MYNTSQNYKNKVLADSTQHELNIYIDGNIVDSNHIIDFKQTIELFNNSEFCLGCTPEIDIEFEIDKRDLAETYNEVYIETGVDDEIIPIGYFTIQSVEDDEFKVKIKATDYMKKFADNNYDGSNLTYPASMLEVLKDICIKIGVELGSTSFLNSDKEIAVYDNTISARTYLAYIAEQAGSIAVIGRDGKLYIKQIGENVIDFNINLFRDYKWGDKFKVSKVSYEDGIQDYKFGDETEATVFIDQSNMYIVDNEQVENIYNQIKDFAIYSFEGETIIDPAYDIGDILVIDGKQILYQGELEYVGKFKANIKSKIQAKTEQESMQTKQDNSSKIKRVQSEINQIDGKITQLVEEQDEQSSKITNVITDVDGIHSTIENNQKNVENKLMELEQTIEGTSQTLTNKGGNNIFYYAKEFWNNGVENETANLEEYTDTEIQQKSVSSNGYIINSGISEQKQNIKKATYTISFNYRKTIELAITYVLINDVRYDLNSTDWEEFVQTINIETNVIDIKFVSDTDEALKIFDLNGNIGNEKQVWTQNPNETRTDTVTIGKGIQVKSNSKNTYARFDADGNRIFNASTNEVVTALTDKGVETEEVKTKVIQVGGILIQEIDNQTWLSSLL